MFFLNVLGDVVILCLVQYFVDLLRHSSSSSHGTLIAAAPMLLHCRGPGWLLGFHYSPHDDIVVKVSFEGVLGENFTK